MEKKKSKTSKFDIIFDIVLALELVAMANALFIQFKDGNLSMPYFDVPVITFEKIYEKAPKSETYSFGLVEGQNYSGAPIVVFGDSAAYGEKLKEEDRFSSQLSQKTQRPVCNKAWGGWSVQNVYWMLTQDKFYREFKQEPKDVIFVYSPFMYRWMYAPDISCNGLRYTVTNGEIQRNPMAYNWINKSYFIAKMFDVYAVVRSKNFNGFFDDFKTYLLEGKKEADKHWKNTNFYILKLTDVGDNDNIERWKELEQEGFKIIEAKDLMFDKYSKDSRYVFDATDRHPTKEFWQDILPKLIKEMDI